MAEHVEYMQFALDLAAKGWPMVQPNPMVGCLIVKDDKIVGSGYHMAYGGAHAEVNAIRSLSPGINTKTCELYVTLEPCSHHGKTPPCVDLIIEKGFKKVIIAVVDPNPLVGGKGIERLKAAGIPTEVGVLEGEAKWLNRRFFTFYEKQRPYYTLKWAQTADGFISRWPIPANRAENLISGKEAQLFSHRLRSESAAILVGKNTVLSDNPQLTTRLVAGKSPLRLFIDKRLEVPGTYHIYDSSAPTIVFNEQKDETEGHITYKKLNFELNVVEQISKYLYGMNIQTVLVEGGTRLLNDFKQQNTFDEILVVVNQDLSFEKGIKAPQISFAGAFEMLGKDKLFRFSG